MHNENVAKRQSLLPNQTLRSGYASFPDNTNKPYNNNNINNNKNNNDNDTNKNNQNNNKNNNTVNNKNNKNNKKSTHNNNDNNNNKQQYTMPTTTNNNNNNQHCKLTTNSVRSVVSLKVVQRCRFLEVVVFCLGLRKYHTTTQFST